MTSVKVSTGPPTEGGRLHPRYDRESDILTVTSATPRDWQFGVNIGGNIVFDLDAKRQLANFDIHVASRLWKRGAVRRWPEQAAAGTIVFSKETIERKSLNMPLRLLYDEHRGVLNIMFGTQQADRELELSNDCIALLSANELVGFLVRNF